MNSQQEPAVIDLGTGPPGPDVPRRRSPHLSRALAALGGVALFASLVGEWATNTYRWQGPDPVSETLTGGLESSGGLGTGWVVGGLAVAACLGLSLFGPARVRAAARAVGLAVTGALAGLLAAMTVVVGRYGVQGWAYRSSLEQVEVEVVLGRGLYAGYAALVLLAAALWLARSAPSTYPAASAAEPAGPAAAGPGEVTVAPAQPVAYPDQRHEWR